jgi:hypothetical protein
MSQQEVKKLAAINFKDLGFSAKEIRKLIEDKKEAVFLARIGGIAMEYFTGESKNGEFTGFKGQFLAITKDGNQYSASTVFFPVSIATKLREQMDSGVTEIEVKADVYATETDKNASGYAYLCEPVMTSEAAEKMAKLQKSILGTALPVQLALAKPAEEKTEKVAAKKSA